MLARQRRVYLSLSSGILREGGESPFRPEQALQALANVILFNFPRIRRLELLIEGQVPRGGSVFRFQPAAAEIKKNVKVRGDFYARRTDTKEEK